MSEHHAPYLHVVRSAPAIEPAPSEAAHEAETPDMGNLALVSDDAMPAPPPLEVAQDGATSAAPSDGASTEPVSQASAALSQAIMYATMSWLALCVERVAVAVDIQPIAGRLYEVSVHYDSSDADHSDGIILRVRLDVEPGLVVRATVEPLRP